MIETTDTPAHTTTVLASDGHLAVSCPETQLLLACARTTHTPETAARVQHLAQTPLDWDRVMQQARLNHVEPLLHRSLQQLCPDAAPAAAQQELQQHYTTGLQRSLLLTGEVLRALHLFDAQGIPAAPLKGPLLAEQLYGSLGWRNFNDLDILIHRRDLWRAKDVLIAHGYQPFITLSRAEEEAYVLHHNDYPLVLHERQVYVELQWEIVAEPFHFPPDIEDWWQRFSDGTLAGRQVRALPLDDLLIILCVHGSKHLWERLSWICDVAELLRVHRTPDWDYIVRRAEACGARRMLFLGLLLARELLAAELPDRVHVQVQAEPKIVVLAQQCCQILFGSPEQETEVQNIAPLLFVRMRERRRDRLQIYRRLYPGLRHPLQALRKYIEWL